MNEGRKEQTSGRTQDARRQLTSRQAEEKPMNERTNGRFANSTKREGCRAANCLPPLRQDFFYEFNQVEWRMFSSKQTKQSTAQALNQRIKHGNTSFALSLPLSLMLRVVQCLFWVFCISKAKNNQTYKKLEKKLF